MKLSEVLSTAGDAITVRRVYAEPYEKDGVTIIPGAMVAGGGGGGGGHDQQGQEGEGAGFGVNARPSGAFVIKDGRVSWRPAVDVNQLFAVLGAVAVAAVFAWARRRGQTPVRGSARRRAAAMRGKRAAALRRRRTAMRRATARATARTAARRAGARGRG